MKLRALGRLATCAVFLLLGSLTVAAPPGEIYHLIKKTTLGGEGATEGRNWDYLTVDAAARRIYISHSTHVLVVDEDLGKVVGDIPDTKGVHGIAIASDLGKGYTSNGGAASVTIFDIKTLEPISTVNNTGKNPNSILYDPDTKRDFTFNGRSANSTVIDATTGKVVGTVSLSGKPETPSWTARAISLSTSKTRIRWLNLTPRRSPSVTNIRSRAARGLPELPWTPPRVASSSAAATAM